MDANSSRISPSLQLLEKYGIDDFHPVQLILKRYLNELRSAVHYGNGNNRGE